MLKSHFILLLLLCFSLLESKAQSDTNQDLFIELKNQDSIFFERSFNQCDTIYLSQHLTGDLKFYHDQSGLQNRTDFFENMRKYICPQSDKKPIRKLEPNSLEVFPLYKNGQLYGAIQKGIHHFYLREKGKVDLQTSSARFSHVWLLEDKTWKLSTVLSFDHQNSIKENTSLDIEKLLIENKVPALGLGIIKNGKLTKVEVFGTLDKIETAPYNTLFKVASLTKPIVAMVTLKLIDKGLLDLNEPLYNYWIDPDIKNNLWYKKLSPEIILTHRTGFANWRYMNDSNKLVFQFEPGTKYQYSGEGFEYLRRALESKFDKSIEELCKEYLFDSLEMKDTRFWWDEKMDEKRYAQNFNEQGKQLKTYKYYEANAAANLLTTIEDYGKFLEYVLNGAGLSKDLYQKMISPQTQIKENEYFGLGWEIMTGFSRDEFALFHTGKDAGVSTLAICFPKSKNGYLLFLNGDNISNVYEELLKQLYLGNELWDKR